MLELFRTNQFIANLLLIFYVVLLRLSTFILPNEEWLPSNSALLSEWLYTITGTTGVLPNVLAILLLFFQAFMINVLVARYRMANTITLFPGLFYILIACSIPSFLHFSPLLMANTFYIFALLELFGTYKRYSSANSIFNVGLSIGLASLFHFSYIIFILLAFIGLGTMRAFKIREGLMLLIGFTIPYYLTWIWYFWYDQSALFWKRQFVDNFAFFDFISQTGYQYYIELIFFGLLIVVTILSIGSYTLKKSMHVQKNISILYWGLLLSILTLLFQANIDVSHLLILTVPLGIFISFNFLTSLSKPMAEVVHLVLLFSIIVLQYKALWLG